MRTRVFYDKPIEACYGCQACAEICPVKAITMVADKEGFLFPEINPSLCIECNQCEKSCPTQTDVVKPLFHPTPETVNAAWNDNLSDRLESTSGGLFYAIAHQWIAEGGIAYGAAFDSQFTVCHIRAENTNTLKRLRGSKYVQSNTAGAFNAVKKDLKSGLKVLFSGTPCQIAGLRAFLKKDYDNLLTIDLVCHGVPSPMIFKEHLAYIERINNASLQDYKFRAKNKSGWRSYVRYIFYDRMHEDSLWGNDFYAYNFNLARFNRKSCFSCEFSQSQRIGDITLSDFWNAEKECKPLRLQRKYGYNLVMCNTDKGKQAYSKISSRIKKIELPTRIAIDGDVRLRHTEDEPKERQTMFELFHEHGYAWLTMHSGHKRSILGALVPIWAKNIIKELLARL